MTDARPSDGELVERVTALVARTLEWPEHQLPLPVEAPLYGAGLGVDSLAALELIAALEEEFAITIDEAELAASTFERVSSIVCLVRRLTGSGS
jgi:acyl carrier protein